MMPEGLRRLKRSAYRIVGREVCGVPVMMGRSVYDRGEEKRCTCTRDTR